MDKKELKENFLKLYKEHGLKKTDLGKKHQIGRDIVVLIGISIRCKKYPIFLERVSDGAIFKYPDGEDVSYGIEIFEKRGYQKI